VRYLGLHLGFVAILAVTSDGARELEPPGGREALDRPLPWGLIVVFGGRPKYNREVRV